VAKIALEKIRQDWARELTFDRAAVNEEKRTVIVSFSSEEPVERYYGNEVLSHDGTACDMSRLNNKAPLLCNHDPEEQIGVVERAWMKDGKGYAEVRFSKSEDAEEVYQDVLDGIRGKISVGYRINSMVLEESTQGADTYRATSWMPYEISVVSVPADDSVGVGRANQTSQTEIPITMHKRILLNPDPAAGGGGNPSPSAPVIQVNEAEIRKTEQKRSGEIFALAKKFEVADADAQRFIAEGRSVDEFRSHILENKPTQKPVDPDAGLIGMNAREVERFSVLKAIRELSFNGRLSGLEKDVCDASMKHLKRDVKDGTIIIPDDVLNPVHMRGMAFRANNATNFGAGGATVQTTLGPMIEILRNRTAVAQAGATMLTGLTGNVALPKQTGTATAYWVSETGALTDSESTFGQMVLTPHRLGATVPYTTQFLAQSSLSVEAFIRDDIMKVLAIAKDLAALHGSGVAGEPLGVQNTTGINATVTFGGAANWADMVEFETGVAVDNADVGSAGFIISAATVGKWKGILRDSVAGSAYLIGDSGLINGYPYQRTNQVTGNIAFFGVWSQLIMASWSGLEVIVDPYALKKSGQVEITVNELCDIGVRQPLSFNVSTDSAIQ
jgi:HK97 family phage major capsid protein/HK97 family phage prohead protease